MKKLKNNLVKLIPQNRLYQLPVPIIGLTGGIGSGKSTVAELFRQAGIPVIDADKNVKKIYQKPETLHFIKDEFPEVVSHEKIDFKKLREIVFVNPDALELLESFLYQHMPSIFLDAYSELNSPEFIVYDVPLLFEKNLHLQVDLSVCVYAPKDSQIERLIKRDLQTSRELAEKILSRQMNIEDKKKISDYVLENTGSLVELRSKFTLFIENILE
jgi:dephospho-CoA kinase